MPAKQTTSEQPRTTRSTPAGIIEAGVVYDLDYECWTPGPEAEADSIRAWWTGYIDPWGKLDIRPIDGGPRRWLFTGEIIGLEHVA